MALESEVRLELPVGFDPVEVAAEAAGVRIAGRFDVGVPASRLTLVVGVAALRSVRLPVLAVVTGLVGPCRQRNPDALVGVVMLANGPALVALLAGEHRFPGGEVFPQVRVEVQVPDGDRLVVVSVAAGPECRQVVLDEALRLAGTVGS